MVSDKVLLAEKNTALDAQLSSTPSQLERLSSLALSKQRVTDSGQDTKIGTVKTGPVQDDLKAEKEKPEDNLLQWYWAARKDSKSEVEGGETDANFAEGFQKLVKTLGLEDTEITVGGKTVKLGEFASKLSTDYKDDNSFNGYPQGIVGSIKLGRGSPLSAEKLESVQNLAQNKGVLGAIQYAAKVTGADESALLMIAKQESGFNAGIRAKTSSATGLFQILDGTADEIRHKHGAEMKKLGIDIYDLKNPVTNAVMGGFLYQDTKRILQKALPGQEIGQTEVYLGHFLGPAGATNFLRHANDNPQMPAAAAMSAGAVAANSFVGGKTAAGLYNFFEHKLGLG